MQLHACLLLFIVTTDKTLASLNHHCGGNVSLYQEPTGLINLTSPGFIDISADPTNQHCDKTLQSSVCTWLLEVPLGKTVLLKFVWLEIGSSVSLRCALKEEDKALQSGDTALLSSCDRNKATLSWTGPGCSSNALQLVYHVRPVQEDERNSSESQSTHQPDQDPTGWSPAGTTFTSPTAVAQEELKGTEEGRGLAWSLGPEPVSGTSLRDERPLRPTSSKQGHPVAGRTDRETLSLPEEKPNNGADTSGATHLVDDARTARTRPYFQHAISTDTKSKTENPTDLNSPKMEMAWTQSSVGRSTAPLGTHIRTSPSIQTSQYTDKYVTSQTDWSVSSSIVVLVTSPPPKTLAWETDTILTVHNGPVSAGTPEDTPESPSLRSGQSTDSDLTSATTSELVKTPIKPSHYDPSSANTATEPTPSSSSSSQDSDRSHSPATHITELGAATTAAASVHPHTSQNDSLVSDASDVTTQTAEFESAEFENTDMLYALTSSSIESKTNASESPERLSHPPKTSSQTGNEEITKDGQQTSTFTGYFSTPRVLPTTTVQNAAAADITRETHTSPTSHTLLHDNSPTDSVPTLTSSTTTESSAPSYMLKTHTVPPDNLSITSSATESSMHTTFVNHKVTPVASQLTSLPNTHQDLLLPTSTNISPTNEPSQELFTPKYTSEYSTINSDSGKVKVEKGEEFWQRSSSTARPRSTARPSQQSSFPLSPAAVTPATSPVFYIVPNQPAAIRVESVELLLQIVVEESRSTLTAGLEEDTSAWVEPYLRRAPGFSKLLGVWSSGHAVQSLVEFKTSGALVWLSMTGPATLLERTGLAQAVREGKRFRSSKITNITLGGLQGDVCDWLLQCPAGYRCVPQAGSTNYSCSSVCRSDYCHHHGICTHHPGQLPVCRCLVGEDFWYMGQRCDVKMTRARLAGACLAVLLIMAAVIGILAFVAVRRYRAILIQTKVDQTRSSYRRFNHFDELSGRFWLRPWAGSADSLDNPAFSHSNELLHLRALDRPCCYHDDTLSLASTCPSHGARINTIYPHSSQYGWRGSEMSVGDGVLDSGKASDLSVCSWPVEPIHWTPFPLLQQLASHRSPKVKVSRPRSYCEGMELVDMGKSWTA